VIKPNAPELAECVGRPLLTLGDIVAAAREVHEWGVNHVLVSLGSDGMVGVSSSGVVHASTDPVSVRNTIGAGDASVAGFLSHCVNHPEEFTEAVARGVAWGALKVQEMSSQLQSLESLPEVRITEAPELDKLLTEPGLV
jgi:1-phosphofructokinase